MRRSDKEFIKSDKIKKLIYDLQCLSYGTQNTILLEAGYKTENKYSIIDDLMQQFFNKMQDYPEKFTRCSSWIDAWNILIKE